MEAITEFKAAMRAHGLTPPDIIEPGRLHRFTTNGKAGDDAGWCKLFPDCEGGVFGDWRTGLDEGWQAKREKPFTPAERKAFLRRCEGERRAREAEGARRWEEAKIKAAAIWDASAPAPDDHAYLVLKRVKPYGLRVADGRLVVPMRNGGELHSVQFIGPNGDKRFLPNGRVKGCSFPIGKPDGVLCIAEGYATASSIHEATGHAATVGFNAANLEPVVRAMRERFPELRLIVCADDDATTPGNPGLTKATEAARAVCGLLAVPDFGENRPEGVTDFNDLHRLCGAEAVRHAIANATEPPKGDHGDSTDSATGDASESPDWPAAVDRLARLCPIEYDRGREQAAKTLGVRVTTLDDEVEKARRKLAGDGNDAQGKAVLFAAVEPWPEPVDGAELLAELAALCQRYVVLPEHADVAIALWVVFTHCVDAVSIAPILALTSPEKRCGKSTVLALLRRLVLRPLTAANITTASLFRSIEAWKPTLLIDEADTFIGSSDELRGVLNSGHTRDSAFVVRTVGENHEPRKFSTWGAKAIALIGKLKDTLADRSVEISLKRKLPGERVGRLRHADPELFHTMAQRCARWATDHARAIRAVRPATPEELHDRAADNWEPLLAIADLVGGVWPERARVAALTLSGGEDAEGDSVRVQLLADIQDVFEHRGADRISSDDLTNELITLEDRPWAEYSRGKPLTKARLSRLLRPFRVVSKSIRLPDGRTPKGYLVDQFNDAFSRYLPSKRHTATT